MKCDNLLDLAYKDIESDDLDAIRVDDYVSDVETVQADFDANYNKMISKRQAGYKPVLEFEPFEFDQDNLPTIETDIETTLEDYQSSRYKNKQRISELQSMFEAQEKKPKVVENIPPVRKSIQERFLHSLRNKSKNISLLEAEVAALRPLKLNT